MRSVEKVETEKPISPSQNARTRGHPMKLNPEIIRTEKKEIIVLLNMHLNSGIRYHEMWCWLLARPASKRGWSSSWGSWAVSPKDSGTASGGHLLEDQWASWAGGGSLGEHRAELDGQGSPPAGHGSCS